MYSPFRQVEGRHRRQTMAALSRAAFTISPRNLGFKVFSMETQPDLAAWLDLADKDLAKHNVPVSDRVILSIHRLVQWEAIIDENGNSYSLDAARLVKNDWFFPLAKQVGGWYRSRYADAARIAQDRARFNDHQERFLRLLGWRNARRGVYRRGKVAISSDKRACHG